MKKFIQVVSAIEEKFIVYTFATTIFLIALQVAFRQFGYALSWSEELARYLFVWQCWVGVSFAQRYEQHIRITIIQRFLSEKGRKIIEILVSLILLGVIVFLIYTGFKLVFALISSNSVAPYTRLPMCLVYTALPTGCFLYGLRLIEGLLKLKPKKTEV